MSISFDTLNSTKTYTFMGPSSGGASGAFTYTVEVTLNSSNSIQDYFSFDVTLKIMCNQPTFTWMNWSSQRVKLYMNAGSGASTNSEYLIHDAGLPDYPSGRPTVTIFTKENILISKPSGTNLYITIKVENTTGTSITYLPGSVTNNNTISVNITGIDTKKLYPESAIQNIADSIREIGNTSSTYKVTQMYSAILNFPTPEDPSTDIAKIVMGTYSGIFSRSDVQILRDDVFGYCSSLTEVNLPNCVSIGASAFRACTNLSFANLPLCSSLNQYCFASCFSLVSVVLSPSLTRISTAAFSSCYSLEEFPYHSITIIDPSAFYACSSLRSISLPNCSSIGGNTFSSCKSLSFAYLPKLNSVQQGTFWNCFSLRSLDLPSCTRIEWGGLTNCSSLSMISLPKCTFIGYDGLRATALSSVDLPLCTTLSTYALANNKNLVSVSLPVCSSYSTGVFMGCQLLPSINLSLWSGIPSSTFCNCYSLSYVYMPNCKFISESAFYNCSALTSISFSQCSTIGFRAFRSCYYLNRIDFPACTFVSTNAFQNCTRLSSVSLPLCSSISGYAFTMCNALTSIYLPSCNTIGISAFMSCPNLSLVDLPIFSGTLSSSAFVQCFNLLSLYLRGSTVANLAGYSVFNSTPIGGYTTSTGGVYGSIYVPASLVDSYKAATNWTRFSSRITAIA